MNWEQIATAIQQAAPRILGVILIFLVGIILIGRASRLAERFFVNRQADQTRLRFLITFVRFSLSVVLILTLLEYLGSFTTTVTTIVGAITLSIGLAMQGALQNLAGGVLIVSGRPFRLGDHIAVMEHSGTVEDIGILTTTLRTADNKKLILPNGKVSSEFITNYTAYDIRRVDVPIRFETIHHLETARQVILELAKVDSDVLDSPSPEIHVMAGDDRNSLILKVWTKTGNYWPVYWRLNEATRQLLLTQEVGSIIPTMNVILSDSRQ